MTADALLAVDRVSRAFDGRVAVDDVSFEVRAGEIVALLGPNGAGKTTTLRLVAGLIEPDRGEIRVAGTRLTRATGGLVRSRLGLLTETPGLWDRLSVHRNLQVYAELQGVPDAGRVAMRALARFGLADRADEPAATLSKGMRQKVALARVLLHEPPLLLLDEPTAGLDPEMTHRFRQEIAALRDEGRAILLSTHDLDEAERLASRVALVANRLVAFDRIEALRARMGHSRVRIRLAAPAAAFAEIAMRFGAVEPDAVDGLVVSLPSPDSAVPALVRALVEAGAPVREVVEDRASLEEIYLALTRDGGLA